MSIEAEGIGAVGPADVPRMARIHARVLPEAFLSRLGLPVLRQIYAGALTAPGTVARAARHQGEVVGFVLGTTGTSALFRHILRRRAPALALALGLALARRPGILAGVLETVRYPRRRDATGSGGSDAELVAIGVLPEHQEQGYGAALVEALSRELARRGVAAYTVTAYADNEAASAFYRRLGFEVAHSFSMYGRPWTCYRLALSRPGPPGP